MFKNGGDYMELETKAIHEGWKPGNGEPRQLPESRVSCRFMRVLLLNMIQVKKWACYLI